MIITRAQIAEALSTADGVTGYAKKPKVTKPGDAWPLVDRLTHVAAGAFETTWRIAVVLGGDPDTATELMDELIPPLTQALQSVVYVDSARPIKIPTEAGDLPGVEIIARSE